MISESTLGAVYQGGGRCRFHVWAPFAATVEVNTVAPEKRLVTLKKDDHGYHTGIIDDIRPGTLYAYRLDGQMERPDPASRLQPKGVHGPSEVVDPEFDWEDSGWPGLPLDRYIIYELHVGAFSDKGTFDGAAPYLKDLKRLGVTAVELMPVAQFPGERNWGYDGVYPFAVQNSYGGPKALKQMVKACHREGLAVVLDAVYNHLGPEGNYFGDFGPYFSDRYQTPWGAPINFDGPHSDDVRRYFIENALYWLFECRIDALRLDAVHAILDFSAYPFLRELTETVHSRAEQLNRRVYLIPESALNDTRLIRPAALGGFELDAQWNDDFHHALHTLLTGENMGYYQDFGEFSQLVKTYREGYVYSGEYSKFRQRRHGNSSHTVPADRFVVFAQNHDQVGNRMIGDRLSVQVPFEALKLVAGCVLLSPFIPLLFMGEEYGETAPFPYFISHADENLVRAVRQGRRREFEGFHWAGDPPDPQDEQTFMSAKLNHALRHQSGHHRTLHDYYRELIRLRHEIKALSLLSKDHMEVTGNEEDRELFVRRWSAIDETFLVLSFTPSRVSVATPMPKGRWEKRLDSNDPRWEGTNGNVANHVSSDGQVLLDVEGYACILFTRIMRK